MTCTTCNGERAVATNRGFDACPHCEVTSSVLCQNGVGWCPGPLVPTTFQCLYCRRESEARTSTGESR